MQEHAGGSWRWLSYVIIGIGIVTLLVALAFHPLGKWDDEYDKWIKGALYTCCLFGYLLKFGWRYRRARRFWALLVGLFVLHFAAFVPLLLLLLANRGLSIAMAVGVLGTCEFSLLAFGIALVMGSKRRKVG